MEIEKGQFDPTQTETNDPPCGLQEKTHKQTKENQNHKLSVSNFIQLSNTNSVT